MLGKIVEPEAFLEQFETGDPAAMFLAEAGLENTAVMFEDQVDLADLCPFLALEAIVERIFAAGIAEFLVGPAAEGFAAGLTGVEDRFRLCHHRFICEGKNKKI